MGQETLYTRINWLTGPEKIEKLKNTSVALFGTGGVGGGALEALVRGGIGRIVLVDGDSIAPSNLNRQMITSQATIGRCKVEVAKERALAINPDCQVEAYDLFYTEEAHPGFIQGLHVDFVIDAIDMVKAKIDIVEQCQASGIGLISSMGGGNRFYPEKIQIADIKKTFNDPLARVMRQQLKKRRINKLTVAFSTEVPTKPAFRGDEGTSPGTTSMVPPVLGFTLAAYVIRTILEVPKQ